MLCVYVVRHICKDEELTIDYGGNYYETRNVRKSRLKRIYDFDCTCEICHESSEVSDAAEAGRSRMIGLAREFKAHEAQRDISQMKLDELEIEGLELFVEHAVGLQKVKA